MIKIINFKPDKGNRAGLKDVISFRITELAPLDTKFKLTQGSTRLASLLSDKQTYKRLPPELLEEEILKNVQFFIDASGMAPQIIDGDVGLVPASSKEIQQERDVGRENLRRKRSEISNLIVYRDCEHYKSFIKSMISQVEPVDTIEGIREYFVTLGFSSVKNISASAPFLGTEGTYIDSFLQQVIDVIGRSDFARKGEVFDIEKYSSGFVSLFSISRKQESRVKKFYKDNLFEQEINNLNIQDEYVSILNRDDISAQPLFYSIQDLQSAPVQIPLLIELNDVIDIEYEFSANPNLGLKIYCNKDAPPKLSEIFEIIKEDSQVTDYLSIEINIGEDEVPISPASTITTLVRERIITSLEVDLNTNCIVTFQKLPNMVRVEETTFSSLPTQQLRDEIEKTKSYYSFPGVIMLRNQKLIEEVLTLKEFVERIRNEIPPTKIYKQFTEVESDSKYLGNLDLQSLDVAMHDDDKTTMLIKSGVAEPGVSVQYKLHRLADMNQDLQVGDVDIQIGLASFAVGIPVVGQQPFGSQLINLQANIESGKVKSEFIFNFQAKNKDGQIVNLYKYGTIKIGDEVTFKNNNQILAKHKVVNVYPEQNGIELDKKIQINFPASTICEIVQTPLNPGRRYRVTVTCQDKEGTN